MEQGKNIKKGIKIMVMSLIFIHFTADAKKIKLIEIPLSERFSYISQPDKVYLRFQYSRYRIDYYWVGNSYQRKNSGFIVKGAKYFDKDLLSPESIKVFRVDQNPFGKSVICVSGFEDGSNVSYTYILFIVNKGRIVKVLKEKHSFMNTTFFNFMYDKSDV